MQPDTTAIDITKLKPQDFRNMLTFLLTRRAGEGKNLTLCPYSHYDESMTPDEKDKLKPFVDYHGGITETTATMNGLICPICGHTVTKFVYLSDEDMETLKKIKERNDAIGLSDGFLVRSKYQRAISHASLLTDKVEGLDALIDCGLAFAFTTDVTAPTGEAVKKAGTIQPGNCGNYEEFVGMAQLLTVIQPSMFLPIIEVARRYPAVLRDFDEILSENASGIVEQDVSLESIVKYLTESMEDLRENPHVNTAMYCLSLLDAIATMMLLYSKLVAMYPHVVDGDKNPSNKNLSSLLVPITLAIRSNEDYEAYAKSKRPDSFLEDKRRPVDNGRSVLSMASVDSGDKFAGNRVEIALREARRKVKQDAAQYLIDGPQLIVDLTGKDPSSRKIKEVHPS